MIDGTISTAGKYVTIIIGVGQSLHPLPCQLRGVFRAALVDIELFDRGRSLIKSSLPVIRCPFTKSPSGLETTTHSATHKAAKDSVFSNVFRHILIRVVCRALQHVLGKLRSTFLRCFRKCTTGDNPPDSPTLNCLKGLADRSARGFRNQLPCTGLSDDVRDTLIDRSPDRPWEAVQHTPNRQQLSQTDSTPTSLHQLACGRIDFLSRLFLEVVHLLASLRSTLPRTQDSLRTTGNIGGRLGKRLEPLPQQFRAEVWDSTTETATKCFDITHERVKLSGLART